MVNLRRRGGVVPPYEDIDLVTSPDEEQEMRRMNGEGMARRHHPYVQEYMVPLEVAQRDREARAGMVDAVGNALTRRGLYSPDEEIDIPVRRRR